MSGLRDARLLNNVEFKKIMEYRELTNNGWSVYRASEQVKLSKQRVMELLTVTRDVVIAKRDDRPYTHEMAGAVEMAQRMMDTWEDKPPVINEVIPVDRFTSDEIVAFYKHLKQTGRMQKF